MKNRSCSQLKVSSLLHVLVFLIFLCFVSETYSSGVVTLDSIQIFQTHEWFGREPTIYFQCQGENKTILPDVKKTNFLYNFKGAESWQPLTELPEDKCKRCGFYEEDKITPDDTLDEWELCPDEFSAPDGKYVRFKEKEFNATFLCPQCKSGIAHSSRSKNGGDQKKGTSVVVVILISALVSSVFVIALVALYKHWQKRKREQDHARFLKLFEEGDDVEDELGLEHVI